MSNQMHFGVACLALLGLAACGEPSEQQPATEAATTAPVADGVAASPEMTCSDPVAPDDTAEELRERYGTNARVETLMGPEGIEFQGVVLWPDDPARRIDVMFEDDAMRHPSSVRIHEESQWRIAGVGLGDPLAKVRSANGGAFEFYGFEWDYGGYVSDFQRGKLASLEPGCGVNLRFGVAEEVELPDTLIGDRGVSSEDPALDALPVKVYEMLLRFDRKETD